MNGAVGGVLGGIPVRVDPSFWLLSAFMGLTSGRGVEGAAVWVVVVGVSILVHELGHAFTFRAFGVQSSILLYSMGGLTAPERGPRLRPGQEVLVSLAGPGVGLVLGAIVFVAAPPGDFPPDSLLRLASLYLLFVNVGWGLVNLLPILPLDGGNVLAAIMQKAMGVRGLRAVRIVSLVAAGALGAVALFYGQPFVALLAFYFGSINFGALRAESGIPRPGPGEEVLLKGLGALRSANFEGAEWAARQVLDQPETPAELQAAAAELLMWTGVASGSLATGAAGLAAFPEGQAPGALAAACVELARDGAPAAPALAAGLCDGSRLIPGAVVAVAIVDAGLVDDLLARLSSMEDQARGAAGVARLQEVLHHGGYYQESARVGRAGFGQSRSGVVAFNTACSLARGGHEDEAVEWLFKAVDAGWSHLDQLDGDEDLVAVRARPRFADVRRRLLLCGPAGPAGSSGPSGTTGPLA